MQKIKSNELDLYELKGKDARGLQLGEKSKIQFTWKKPNNPTHQLCCRVYTHPSPHAHTSMDVQRGVEEGQASLTGYLCYVQGEEECTEEALALS